MTTPTQAHITAAAKAFHEQACDGEWPCTFCLDGAEAALTAAAQAEDDRLAGLWQDKGQRPFGKDWHGKPRAMTAPTQAQIEADTNALIEELLEAQISNIDPLDQKRLIHRWHYLISKKLTAAALVGEPEQLTIKLKERSPEAQDAYLQGYRSAIEHCAQVAEQIRDCDYQSMLKIAAAIRKLKDTP